MPQIQKSEEAQDEASAIDSLSDLSIQPLISVSSNSGTQSQKGGLVTGLPHLIAGFRVLSSPQSGQVPGSSFRVKP